MSMKNIFVILVFTISLNASAEELQKIFSGWGLSKTPVQAILDLKDRSSASPYKDMRVKRDRHIISKINGKIDLKINDDYPRETKLVVGDITYSSFDKGEFGGELGYSINGKYTPLLKGNVRQLILFGEKLYILEGLDHMISRGAVYAISDAKSPTTPERITMLPESPKASLVNEGGQLIIAGSNGIYIVSDYFFYIAYWDAIWNDIFLWGPTSIVEKDNKILIGLPKGIAVLE